MEWITRQEVKEAAKGTKLDAARFSLKHWKQGVVCSYESLSMAISTKEFNVGTAYCALCISKDVCESCPLGPKACCKEHKQAEKAFRNLENDRSRANFKAFQAKAILMCERLEKEIAKLEKEESVKSEAKLRHGDYGYSDRSGRNFLVVEEDGLRWVNQDNVTLSVKYADCIEHFVVQGNIFDDMKRNGMDEDLEKFTIGTLDVEINEDMLMMKQQTDMIHLARPRWVAFHRQLGQLITTDQRRKAK